MDLLNENGEAIGVLKEGVFFNSCYKDIRNYLVNNFNVISVTSIPSDAFENTTTKTSIIYFKNNGPTQNVKFYDLIVNKYEED